MSTPEQELKGPEEHEAETPGTGNPTPSQPPVPSPGDEPRSLKLYKPLTIRARESTRQFFDTVEKTEKSERMNTADACEKVIADLYRETNSSGALAQSTKVLGDKIKALEIELTVRENELKSALAEHEILLGRIERLQSENKIPEGSALLELGAPMEKLLKEMARRRFANARVVKAYGLTQEETPAELLVNCIRTEEILFDHNNVFFTGFSRKELAAYLEGKG